MPDNSLEQGPRLGPSGLGGHLEKPGTFLHIMASGVDAPGLWGGGKQDHCLIPHNAQDTPMDQPQMPPLLMQRSGCSVTGLERAWPSSHPLGEEFLPLQT